MARRQFLPPQHGAWAMLVVPYLAGLIVAGWAWVDLPLLGAWLAGYPLSYYLFQSLKAHQLRRYRHQLSVYCALTVPMAAVVVWFRPAVLWYAPPFAALLSVNAWYAWRRRERALVNDIASVVQSCLIVFVVATVADSSPIDHPLSTVVGAFAVCAAYFLGTALYVKTMIRERDVPAYRYASVGYHLAVLTLTVWYGVWFVLLFGWLLIRAWVFPGRRLTPKRVGLIEIVNCLLLLTAIWLTRQIGWPSALVP